MRCFVRTSTLLISNALCTQIAGKRILNACRNVIEETREQQRRRDRFTWFSGVFGTSNADIDAQRIQHYLAIAETTSHTLDTQIPDRVRREVDERDRLLRTPSPHIVQPRAVRPQQKQALQSLPLKLEHASSSSSVVHNSLEERAKEITVLNRKLEETGHLVNTVAKLVDQAEPSVQRLDQATEQLDFDMEKSRRSMQRYHDRHVSVALANQNPGIILGQCGLTMVEELRVLVVLTSVLVTALIYYGTYYEVQ